MTAPEQPPAPRRRSTDRAGWPLRAWHECTDPLRDRAGSGLSMTKMISAFFAYWVGYSIGAQHGVVTANALWLAIVTLAAAFGKSTFNFLLSKASRERGPS